MPEEEARSFLKLLEDRITSSEIELRHRDALLRLRTMIEQDLTVVAPDSSVVTERHDQETQAA